MAGQRARQRHDIFTPCVLSFLIECHHTLHFADKSQTSSMNWGKSRTCVSRKVDTTCFPAAVLAHGSSQPAMSVSRVWRCSISTANRAPRSLPKSKCDDPDHCQIAGGWGNPATSQGNRRYVRRTKQYRKRRYLCPNPTVVIYRDSMSGGAMCKRVVNKS